MSQARVDENGHDGGRTTVQGHLPGGLEGRPGSRGAPGPKGRRDRGRAARPGRGGGDGGVGAARPLARAATPRTRSPADTADLIARSLMSRSRTCTRSARSDYADFEQDRSRYPTRGLSRGCSRNPNPDPPGTPECAFARRAFGTSLRAQLELGRLGAVLGHCDICMRESEIQVLRCPRFLILAAAAESGCVGAAYYGTHCGSIENPSATSTPGHLFKGSAGHVATADQVRQDWGAASETQTCGDGVERWTYFGAIRWKGVLVFAVVLPIPLLIPVGRERVSIDFRNGVAVAGDAITSEELWSAFLGLHLHNGWTAEIKSLDLPDMPSPQLEKASG